MTTGLSSYLVLLKSVNVVKSASLKTDWTRRLSVVDLGPGEAERLVARAGGEEDQVQGDPEPGLQRRDDQLTGHWGRGSQ